LVKGFIEFDRDVNIQGIILNNIGSDRHVKLIRDSLNSAGIMIPVIGAVPKNKNFSIPSRHLGLEMAHENNNDTVELAKFIEMHIDIDAVKCIAGNFKAPELNFEEQHEQFDVTIGIANDSAFCFYYQDTFDSLKMSGADLVFFSPMSDKLPQIDGLYLGGGYPELFAKELEASNTRHEIKKAAEDGMPIYGECGALLYLGASLETDSTYRMAGVLGANSRMTGKLQALGYTEAQSVMDSPIAKKGAIIRGHEFHYSTTECNRDARFVYRLRRGKGIFEGRDGLMEHNTMASYMHTHPDSNSFEEFMRQCSRYRSR
jgi:cobyrinic acid a,c-diamide synthase